MLTTLRIIRKTHFRYSKESCRNVDNTHTNNAKLSWAPALPFFSPLIYLTGCCSESVCVEHCTVHSIFRKLHLFLTNSYHHNSGDGWFLTSTTTTFTSLPTIIAECSYPKRFLQKGYLEDTSKMVWLWDDAGATNQWAWCNSNSLWSAKMFYWSLQKVESKAATPIHLEHSH